ncbi:hypothetical protein G5I_04874 [Acromyrmex echinatior]|uniref:Uncharacterized protein n=1 Tax=Acromyrmex echinatior TaxID=103372 RepID=F4WGS4_ACREC|nr:hypothetical protein G5I_04874 [Acromyrmex echinatior]
MHMLLFCSSWAAETQLTGSRTSIQKFPQYYPSSMLPPPPPAPMARPVAIIRSTGELAVTTANSPPTSSPTDPAELGPNQEQMTTAAAVGLVGSACQNSVEPVGRKSPTRILVTPHTSNREYTFAHFHSQPGQAVASFTPKQRLDELMLFLQAEVLSEERIAMVVDGFDLSNE